MRLTSRDSQMLLITVIAFAALPALVGPYGNFLLASVLIYFLISLSLTILIGFAGQISIGHAGFWAIGAYGSAFAVMKLGLPFITGMFLAGMLGALFGALVALPALRVQGHYLAIATLSFSVLVQQVLFEWEALSGGRQGFAVSRPVIAGYEFSTDQSYVYLLLLIALVCAWLTENLRKSHTGRSLMALKGSPIATQMSGASRARHLVVAFSLSGCLTGLSGALYAHLIGFLSTETFSLSASLAFLCMAVVGGLGSCWGALLGAIYLAVAPELFRELKDAQMIVYGVMLILCMRLLPGGLVSIPVVIQKMLRRR